jgi:hypothetical protein
MSTADGRARIASIHPAPGPPVPWLLDKLAVRDTLLSEMGTEPLEEGALVELLDAAPDGILLVGADGLIGFVNEAAQQLFGYTQEELIGATIETLVPPRYHARHGANRESYSAQPRRRPMGLGMQLQGVRKDGSEFPVEISLAPLHRHGETQTISIIRDATEQRVLQEERLRYARSQAVEEIVAGLEAIVWEAAGADRESLIYVGGRDAALLGFSREQWMTRGFWRSAVHPDDRVAALAFADSARERDTFELEYRLIDSGGRTHKVRDIVSVTRDGDGTVERTRGVIVDITDQRELESRLAEAQKLQAVGQLAGGIAHDFNNLLTIASGYARRLRTRDDLTVAHDDLDQIVTATDRAAELTRQLLAFARRGQGAPDLLDPGETARALEPMLRRLIDADIVFDFRVAQRVPRVLMDRTELEQVLMNLILNASDAMRDGGTLTVACEALAVSDTEAQAHGLGGGDYVCISVSDTGAGIPASIRDRIFEPFFTTKHEKGTGMGLATVYGVVDQAGGWIDLESTVGKGTIFRILLPAAGGRDVVEREPEPSGRATVLLVEDESALRQLVVTILEEEGYTVLQAGNGLDAIALAESHSGPLDLLITDVVMPRLSGPELAQRLRDMRPGLDVLFMSGYNDSRLVSRGVEESSVNLLVKPFRPDQLVARVNEMIGAD